MYNGRFVAHVAFWIGCGSFAAYTTVLQFVRYHQNADTPKISYKNLHHSAREDVYPDITICFNSPYTPSSAKRGTVHNNFYLQKYHSLSNIQYNDLLIGNEKAWNEVQNATRVADVNFADASLKLSSMFYRLVLQNGQSNVTKDQLIQKSFQIPGTICFTRSFGSYLEGYSVSLEYFFGKLFGLKPQPMMVMAFVHYPGQTLRTIFGQDRMNRADFELTGAMLQSNSNFKVKLNQMSVLKKRPDSVKPCDPTPTDDERFWEELFSRIPCLPAYWKEFHHTKNSTLKDCTNYTQFSELSKFIIFKQIYLKETERILASLPVPCNEMEISATSGINVHRDAAKQTPGPELGFTYSMTKYHEIRNERDFGMESVWSCIGGYIGLFIGCSLLSLLDDGYDLLLFWFRAKGYRNNLAKHCPK